jgi:hypothetical protein
MGWIIPTLNKCSILKKTKCPCGHLGIFSFFGWVNKPDNQCEGLACKSASESAIRSAST